MLFTMINTDRYCLDHNVNIHDIKKYFRANTHRPEVSLFEFGIDGRRFDLIKINCCNRHIKIFEFKSTRANFTSDKKWKSYLPYCHTLTFVCPQGIINRNELPKGIGLFNVFKWQHRNSKQRLGRTSKQRLGGMWIKRPRSHGTPSEQCLSHIAFTAVSKIPYRDYFK